jgi:hypothetical protein
VITDAYSDEQFRVLDLHHHLGPDEGARATDPRSTTAVFPERVAIMDRFGVDPAVLMPPNMDASAKRAILYDNAARLLGLQASTRLENAAPR